MFVHCKSQQPRQHLKLYTHISKPPSALHFFFCYSARCFHVNIFKVRPHASPRLDIGEPYVLCILGRTVFFIWGNGNDCFRTIGLWQIFDQANFLANKWSNRSFDMHWLIKNQWQEFFSKGSFQEIGMPLQRSDWLAIPWDYLHTHTANHNFKMHYHSHKLITTNMIIVICCV